MVHLCIPRDLDSKYFFSGRLMVSTLDNLGEGAFAENLHNFVPIGQMPTNFNFVITFDIVEDGIALEFAIIIILLRLLLLLIKSPYPIILPIFKTLNIFSRPQRNCSSIIDYIKLILSFPELLNFFIEHSVFVEVEKTPIIQSLLLITTPIQTVLRNLLTPAFLLLRLLNVLLDTRSLRHLRQPYSRLFILIIFIFVFKILRLFAAISDLCDDFGLGARVDMDFLMAIGKIILINFAIIFLIVLLRLAVLQVVIVRMILLIKSLLDFTGPLNFCLSQILCTQGDLLLIL